jgi:hypothetical protein
MKLFFAFDVNFYFVHFQKLPFINKPETHLKLSSAIHVREKVFDTHFVLLDIRFRVYGNFN